MKKPMTPKQLKEALAKRIQAILDANADLEELKIHHVSIVEHEGYNSSALGFVEFQVSDDKKYIFVRGEQLEAVKTFLGGRSYVIGYCSYFNSKTDEIPKFWVTIENVDVTTLLKQGLPKKGGKR